MLLKELINKSVYGTIGYISSQDDINLLEQYILYNLPVLKEFKKIVVATNYGVSNWHDLQKQRKINFGLWRKYFPECVLIDSRINRGHNFGTADLDNMLFDWCKKNNEEWLCKSSNDVILKESILNKDIEEADFYYLTSVGYSAFSPPYEVNVDKVYSTNEYFYPNTNFYFINTSKCEYLNDKNHIDEIYNYVQTIPDYNGKSWEYGFRSCEFLLKETIENHKMVYSNLLNKEKFHILLDIIRSNNIHDPSHKNIMIDGICHFQFNNQPIIEI